MDIRRQLSTSPAWTATPRNWPKWGLGLEVTDFCYAPMLDDPRHPSGGSGEKMAGIDHFLAPRPVCGAGSQAVTRWCGR